MFSLREGGGGVDFIRLWGKISEGWWSLEVVNLGKGDALSARKVPGMVNNVDAPGWLLMFAMIGTYGPRVSSMKINERVELFILISVPPQSA